MEHHVTPTDWLPRLSKMMTKKSEGQKVWVYFPRGDLASFYTTEALLCQYLTDSLWNPDATENNMYHPMDYCYKIHEKFARKIYMPYSSADPSLFNNTAAIRILIDQLLFEVPRLFNMETDAFKNLPRGPVFFIQTLRDKLFSYDERQFKRDWPMFFRNNIPSYQMLRRQDVKDWRYPLSLIERIRNHEKPVLDYYVKTYLLEPITGVCTQEDRCETMLLGVSLLILTGKPWYTVNQFPSRLVAYEESTKENVARIGSDDSVVDP
jgi:hypothetical protein